MKFLKDNVLLIAILVAIGGGYLAVLMAQSVNSSPKEESAVVTNSPVVKSEQASSSNKTSPNKSEEQVMMVYKDPNCGCCEGWVKHMRENGFKLKVMERSQQQMTALKDSLGIAKNARSCHTATLGKLVIEGHVPAAQVAKAMVDSEQGKKSMQVLVPGMLPGTPGMGPYMRPYKVYQKTAVNEYAVYAEVQGEEDVNFQNTH